MAAKDSFVLELTREQLALIKILIESATWKGEMLEKAYSLLQIVTPPEAKPE